ncbi:MAG: CHAT domain-containing protein [Caldilineaceae bacterium]|nr:CHAT domain-containing protein [Caldilineaceae bacterium]
MAVYNDFSIEISATPTGYAVRARTPAGQAQAETSLPLSPLELENRLQAVELSLLRGQGGLRRALSENERQAQELGQLLFDFLISGDVRALYDLSRLDAERGERGLRLRLSIAAPELATLPWELLYHSREGEFLALSHATPVLRATAAPFAQQALTVVPPLRVLGVVAGPKDWEPLDVAQEKRRLDNALAPLQQTGLAELVWLEGQTRRDLQAAMRIGPWHIIHFIGHGGFDSERDEGFIVLCDEERNAARLYAVELARLIADHPSLRLVFLNACEGAATSQGDDLASSAAALVRRSVPAVVAMQYPISDAAAIEFARTFYESLADNLPVDAAVTDARKAVSFATPHSPEWATPVLFLSSHDGRLFSVEKAVSAPSAPDSHSPLDEPSPAPTRQGRSILSLSLLAGAMLLAFGLWQYWPWQKDETAPTPKASVIASLPEAVATPVPAIGENENQKATETATAEESAVSSVSTSPDPAILLHVTFDDRGSIEQPKTGVSGATNLPGEAFVDGYAQAGVAIDQRGQFVRFPAAGTISLEAGEIELRYRPNFDYGDNPPIRNNHTLFVVGDIYNPPHFLLTMSDRLRMEYLADWDDRYFAESTSPALPWTKGDWLHIRAVWDRSSPDDAFQLYVNDVRVDVTRTGGGWPLPQADQIDTLWLGSGSGDLDANGVLDELIIRGPSATPVATLSPTPVPGVLLQLSLEDVQSIRSPVAGPAGITTLPASVFVPGRLGNGLRFGEERGVVAFPLASASPRPIDFAQGEIDFWYQPAYAHDPTSNETHALINAGDWYDPTQLRLAVIGRLTFSLFDDSSTSFGVRTSLTRSLWKAGEWVHIRAAWDAAQTDDPIQLYVNDERVDTDRSPRAWQVEAAQLPESLFIGGASNEGILPADGIIDELIIRAAPAP